MLIGIVFGAVGALAAVYLSTHPSERDAIGSRVKDWIAAARDEFRNITK